QRRRVRPGGRPVAEVAAQGRPERPSAVRRRRLRPLRLPRLGRGAEEPRLNAPDPDGGDPRAIISAPSDPGTKITVRVESCGQSLLPGALSLSPRTSSASSRRPRARSTEARLDRKSTRLNSSHVKISYAVFCLKKKNNRHSRR